jgi:hypothetical protein
MVAVGVSRAMAGIEAARRSWGEQEEVWVASAAVEPGQPIRAARRRFPQAVVPESAVTVVDPDAVARQHIARGAILTEVDVAAPGPAGLIPDGWLAFAIPAAGAHFAVGDRLRVYAGDQLVAAGVVIGRGDADLMVAIPVDVGPAMATAILANNVTIALTPDP